MSDLRASAATVTVAVDARSRDVAAAEHLAHEVGDLLPTTGRASYVVSTHVVTSPTPHVVVVASWTPGDDGAAAADPAGLLSRLAEALPEACVVVHVGRGDAGADPADPLSPAGPEDLVEATLSALGEHRARASGRLVDFPGRTEVQGRVSVAQVVAGTCVDEVAGLAGLDLDDDTVLDLADFYRPTWHQGRCSLLVQATAGAPVPFEARDQIACCSDH